MVSDVEFRVSGQGFRAPQVFGIMIGFWAARDCECCGGLGCFAFVLSNLWISFFVLVLCDFRLLAEWTLLKPVHQARAQLRIVCKVCPLGVSGSGVRVNLTLKP